MCRNLLLACLTVAAIGIIGGVLASTPVRAQQSNPAHVVYRRVDDRALTLDVFLPPTTDGAGLHPAVVFFHGNGAAPAEFWSFARAFAAQGYVAVSADYRDCLEFVCTTFPGPVADAKAAVRWLRAHAGEYGVDPSRVIAAGHSFGGHLAALVALTPGMWEDGDNLDQSSAVQAVLLSASTLDGTAPGSALGSPTLVTRYLGGTLDQVPDVYAAASAFSYASAAAPPVLLLHGTADQLVPYAQSVRFQAALLAVGGTAELFTADGGDHNFLISPAWYDQTLAAMLAFAAQYV
jgi:acetyl esterase/lipase